MLGQSFFYILTIISLMFLTMMVRKSYYLGKRKNRFYIFAVISNTLVLMGYVGRSISVQHGMVGLAYISNLITYLFGPLIVFFLAVSSAKKGNKLIVGLGILEIIDVVVVLSSPFTGLCFRIAEDASYSRGPLYLYNAGLGLVAVVVWGICSFIEYKDSELTDKIHMGEMILIVIISIILESFNSTYKLMYVGGAFLMFMYYAFQIETNGKYDSATGARSKRYYSAAIDKLDKKSCYSVILFDANGLKRVNDTIGHEAGDRLLKAVVRSISKALGDSGNVYRIGGDEFVALIKNEDEQKAKLITEAAKQNMDNAAAELGFEVSAAAGIAVHIEDEEYEDLFKRADKAMYENKRNYYMTSGRDRRSR